MKLKAVVRMMAATETRFFSSSLNSSMRSRSSFSARWSATSSRRSFVSSESAGMERLLHRGADGRSRHRRIGGAIVDHALAQFRIGLVEVVLRPRRRRISAPPLELAEARVEHALHPVEAEEDGIVLPQIVADGQHPLCLRLALLRALLAEEAGQMEGEIRLRRAHRQRPEVHLAESEAASGARGLAL